MTDQPIPETDAKLADDPQPSSDSPDYARALEIQRNEARAERARLLSELADERAKKSDALIAAVNDIERLTAERDALRAAQQTVARLREALEQCYLHIRHAKDCATKAIIWSPCDCGMPEAEKLAREALATSAQ